MDSKIRTRQIQKELDECEVDGAWGWCKSFAIREDGLIFLRSNELLTLLNQFVVDGYFHVTLKSESFRVHRLVAKAFVDNIHNYNFINHIDGNIQNNHRLNLEWVSKLDNLKARRISYPYHLDKHQIEEIRILKSKGVSNARIALRFDLEPSAIEAVIKQGPLAVQDGCIVKSW